MKFIGIYFFILFSSWTLIWGQNGASMKVMTYNIRLDNPDDGVHSWTFRRPHSIDLIQQNEIDIVGAQEVLYTQLLDLMNGLKQYAYVGVGRADGQTAGEFSPIIYRKDRFEVVDSGTFWLSETPHLVGSIGWDAAMERICTWCIFKDFRTNNTVVVLNTHFDHVGMVARSESALLLVDKVKSIAKGRPVIVTGDLNSTVNSESIASIKKERLLSDTYFQSEKRMGPDWSFHGFGHVSESQRELVDYIFVSADFKVLLYQNIFKKVGNTYYSDHNPIVVHLQY